MSNATIANNVPRVKWTLRSRADDVAGIAGLSADEWFYVLRGLSRAINRAPDDADRAYLVGVVASELPVLMAAVTFTSPDPDGREPIPEPDDATTGRVLLYSQAAS